MNSIEMKSIPLAFTGKGSLTSIQVRNIKHQNSFHYNKRQKLTKALKKISCDLEKTANSIASTGKIACTLPNKKQHLIHNKILWRNQENLATATATATATAIQDQILEGTDDT